MPETAIRVEALSKRYKIGQRERYYTLRDSLSNLVKAPFRRLSHSVLKSQIPKTNAINQTNETNQTLETNQTNNSIWALKDVSFEVKYGEVVGIIGRNGAGKTTLLKILSRITEPTEGYAEIRGRVGSLLEVGTGFHQELTGRENTYLSGAILGMKKVDIDKKFDEIIAFAELEKFLDTPVKHYSSGMYVRLAFAVAAHLEPEILLVDEVLAVGDVQFQKKCLGKMGDVAKEGRTVLFVSHNLGAVKGLCTRGIWIDQGQIAMEGEIEQTISCYLDSIFKKGFDIGAQRFHSDNQLQVTRVVLKNSEKIISTEIVPGDDLTVEIHFYAPRRFYKPNFWISIESKYGSLFGASMLLDGHCPDYVEGEGVLSCTFKSLPLIPQTYTVNIGVRAQDGLTSLAPSQEVGFFKVVGLMKEHGFPGELADVLSWTSSPAILPYEWGLPNGKIVTVNGFRRKE